MLSRLGLRAASTAIPQIKKKTIDPSLFLRLFNFPNDEHKEELARFHHFNTACVQSSPSIPSNDMKCINTNVLFDNLSSNVNLMGMKFPYTEIAILRLCDQDVFLNNISRQTFPRLEKIYTDVMDHDIDIYYKKTGISPNIIGHFTNEFVNDLIGQFEIVSPTII